MTENLIRPERVTFTVPLPEPPVEMPPPVWRWYDVVEIDDSIPERHQEVAGAFATAAPDDGGECARGADCVGASPDVWRDGKPAGPLTGAYLGFALAGDADEFMNWHTPWLVVAVDGRTVAVCEECADVLDPQPAPAVTE